MKNHFIKLNIALLLLVLIASCSKDDEEVTEPACEHDNTGKTPTSFHQDTAIILNETIHVVDFDYEADLDMEGVKSYSVKIQPSDSLVIIFFPKTAFYTDEGELFYLPFNYNYTTTSGTFVERNNEFIVRPNRYDDFTIE